DRADVLDHAGAPLDAEPGVDVLGRQGLERPVGLQVVLHEDEVVELHVAVALAAGAAVLAPAAVLGAAVEEDLRARAARARLARLPEVVLAEPDDALGREADALPRVDCDRVLGQAERRIALVDG